MKEEIRRENELENFLVTVWKSIEAYRKPIGVAIVVAIVVLLASVFMEKQKLNAQKQIWEKYFAITAMDAEKPEVREEAMKAFAKDNMNTLPGSLVAFEQAIQELQNGAQKLAAKDVAAAKEALTNSASQFQALNAVAPNEAMKQMTLFAMAKNAEIMATVEKPEENLKAATEYYGQVARQKDAYGNAAKAILDTY
ncbi:MAG: hypothetical protein Q4C70_05985, partial [Planctomycetia bacterium]|nr:hypothetical protein [Planctomycetia bacterium]